MSKKLRHVSSEYFKTAIKAGREHIKNLLVCKSAVSAIVKVSDPGDSKGRVLQFTSSTKDVDRDNDTLEPTGWELTDYLKNPTWLWAHNWHESLPPIGRALKTWMEPLALKHETEFTPRDLNPFGFMCGEMAAAGFMPAVSVGFIPKEWKENADRPGYCPHDFLKQSLLEVSSCPVGSNPNALLGAKSAGIDIAPMAEFAAKALDRNEDSGLYLPREDLEALYRAAKGDAPVISIPSSTVAAEDVSSADKGASTTDPAAGNPTISDASTSANDDQGADVVALAKDAAAKLGKAIDALADRIVVTAKDFSDFVKQGRVLSASNEDKLRQARDLLSAVIAQVEDAEDDETGQDPEEASAPQAELRSDGADLVNAIVAVAKAPATQPHTPLNQETSALSADKLKAIAEDVIQHEIMKVTGRVPDFLTRRI